MEIIKSISLNRIAAEAPFNSRNPRIGEASLVALLI